MEVALRLARRSLGNCWPNPAVGCVLVGGTGGERIIGRGWTQAGGRPHAEREALDRAGRTVGPEAIAGGTAYVSLEPCSHHGETPPCADAFVDAHVGRVVIACEDPDPRVAGRGVKRLDAAGIATRVGVLAEAALSLNSGFLTRLGEGRPEVTLKTGSSLDARIATAAGESQWITGSRSRRRTHLLRAQHDAVMVGVETVIRDDPSLDCRLEGLEDRSPVRVVVDSTLRLPADRRVVQTARALPTCVLTTARADPAARDQLVAAGVEIIETAATPENRVDLAHALERMGDRGFTRLLVEGGGTLAAAMVAAGLVDRIAWFRAPRLIGDDGVPAVAGLGLPRLAEAPAFAPVGRYDLGDGVLELFARPGH